MSRDRNMPRAASTVALESLVIGAAAALGTVGVHALVQRMGAAGSLGPNAKLIEAVVEAVVHPHPPESIGGIRAERCLDRRRHQPHHPDHRFHVCHLRRGEGGGLDEIIRYTSDAG